MALPRTPPLINFPVEVCLGRATNRLKLRMNFMPRNMEYTISILNEGNSFHLKCDQCELLILWEALVVGHLGTAMYKRGLE